MDGFESLSDIALGYAKEQASSAATGSLNTISSLASSTVTDSVSNVSTPQTSGKHYISTSYAMGFANSTARPKLKFMFRVEFTFYPAALDQMGSSSAKWRNGISFLVKSIDRPKYDVEMEEVNRYNHRTSVVKNFKHREVALSMIDDCGNEAYSFFRYFVTLHQPVARQSLGSSFNPADVKTTLASPSSVSGNDTTPRNGGMLYTSIKDGTTGVFRPDIGNYAPAPTDYGSLIKSIKVSHIITDPTLTLKTAAKEHAYFYINPRIKSIDLGGNAYDTSEGLAIDMVFDYDYLVMTDIDALATVDGDKFTVLPAESPGEPNPAKKFSHRFDQAQFNSPSFVELQSRASGLQPTSPTFADRLNAGLAKVAEKYASKVVEPYLKSQLHKLNVKVNATLNSIVKQIPGSAAIMRFAKSDYGDAFMTGFGEVKENLGPLTGALSNRGVKITVVPNRPKSPIKDNGSDAAALVTQTVAGH